MLNNILNATSLTVIVAIASSAAFAPSPTGASKPAAPVLAMAHPASAPVKVVQLPTVVIVGQRDRAIADAR